MQNFLLFNREDSWKQKQRNLKVQKTRYPSSLDLDICSFDEWDVGIDIQSYLAFFIPNLKKARRLRYLRLNIYIYGSNENIIKTLLQIRDIFIQKLKNSLCKIWTFSFFAVFFFQHKHLYSEIKQITLATQFLLSKQNSRRNHKMWKFLDMSFPHFLYGTQSRRNTIGVKIYICINLHKTKPGPYVDRLYTSRFQIDFSLTRWNKHYARKCIYQLQSDIQEVQYSNTPMFPNHTSFYANTAPTLHQSAPWKKIWTHKLRYRVRIMFYCAIPKLIQTQTGIEVHELTWRKTQSEFDSKSNLESR